MTESNDTAAIGVYEDHAAAENAVKELKKAGFDMNKLSVVGRDHHTEEEIVGYITILEIA